MLELYRPSVKHGLRMGILSILIFLLIYAIDPMFFGNFKGLMVNMAVSMVIIPIVFMILGSRDTKANFTPYTFGKAFNAAFFTAVVSALVLLVFNAVFITIIDPDWEAEIMDQVLRSTETFMEDMGSPQEAIDKAMEQTRAKMDGQAKGILGALKTTGGSLVWYAILALIIGAVQKDPKQEEQTV